MSTGAVPRLVQRHPWHILGQTASALVSILRPTWNTGPNIWDKLSGLCVSASFLLASTLSHATPTIPTLFAVGGYQIHRRERLAHHPPETSYRSSEDPSRCAYCVSAFTEPAQSIRLCVIRENTDLPVSLFISALVHQTRSETAPSVATNDSEEKVPRFSPIYLGTLSGPDVPLETIGASSESRDPLTAKRPNSRH